LLNLNRVISLIFIVVGGLVIWEISGINAIGTYGPGPKIMPMTLGILLIVLSLINIIKGERIIEKGTQVFNKTGIKKVVLVGALFALYIIGFSLLGFTLANFLFFLLIMGVVEKMEPLKTLLSSLFFTVFIHMLFYVWLQVDVPQGLLENLL